MSSCPYNDVFDEAYARLNAMIETMNELLAFYHIPTHIQVILKSQMLAFVHYKCRWFSLVKHLGHSLRFMANG